MCSIRFVDYLRHYKRITPVWDGFSPDFSLLDLFSHFARRRPEARGKSADEVWVIVKSALAADLRDGEGSVLEELSGIIEAQSVEILLEALAHLFLEACGKVIWCISCDCGYRRERRILAEMPEYIYHGSRYA